VVEEEEHQIVIAALDAITELLKECKEGVTGVQGHSEMIVTCVRKIMKGECACQDAAEAEGGDEGDEDEEAEQDEMLFEYAGEVLPNLGRALTPATFAPYFESLLSMLLKKTNKHCTVAERSFAVGAIADSMEPLAGALGPFHQNLVPFFVEMLKDSEDDVRNNAVYGLGEVVMWGGEDLVPHYTLILATLSKLLGHEKSPRVIDQVVGAVSRFVIANLAKVPVDDIVPAVLANLPLKEDLDEYEIVFKFFLTLFSAGHALTIQCLPKMLVCSSHFTTAYGVDKGKTSPLVSQLMKAMAGSFGPQMEMAMAELPSEQKEIIARILES